MIRILPNLIFYFSNNDTSSRYYAGNETSLSCAILKAGMF
jgi:hypothetical protein